MQALTDAGALLSAATVMHRILAKYPGQVVMEVADVLAASSRFGVSPWRASSVREALAESVVPKVHADPSPNTLPEQSIGRPLPSGWRVVTGGADEVPA
jgi:hypothetical protein